MRIRLIKNKTVQLDAEEGGARGGLARRTLAAAEHAYSTPRPKWSAECEKNALSTDAPEGVVGENIVEVRVQPFSCSGTLNVETTRDLMRAQLGK